ncbi:RHS repeat-associated protein [Saccharopolyspora lacisalsi]|uniref:RHS repeat-associated protein n=1 Tax=Halosaccharopolyspora lacisalsi TaxID=1000566 RepID=A0A839DRG4_9PSEU|nr:RHS repeat-associated core domain-containing protein [Halosaccharopolyspora lacisalsi]MBA8823309.1 RHS repeat-associated protein [Halosaccharopolyspora lacisalsi]
MSEPNPLIAERQDSTEAVTGIGIAESAEDLHSGIESGSWSEIALGGVGTGLEALSLAMDPLGTLAQYAVSWLIEHVEPLSDALEWLTGDADQIAAYAQSWRNVAESVGEVAKDFAAEITSVTEGWTGKAAEAYQAATAKQAERIEAASTAADTIGTVVELVGVLVGLVRELVRDLIAECVSAIVVRIPQWTAELGGTLGIATPHVVSSAVSLISKWVNRIKDFIVKLNRSLEKLQPLMGRLDEIWAAIRKGLSGKGGGPDAPASTTPSSTDAPAGANPAGTDAPASTNPSSTDATPTDTPSSPSKPDGSSPDGNGPANTTPSGTKTPDGSKPPSMNKNGAGTPENSSPASQKNQCGDPIDVATGSMVLAQTDVELPAALPLVIKRVHLSSYRVGRFFGPTWGSTLDQRLEVDESNVCFAADDGTLIAYPHPAPGASVMADKGPHRPLSRTDDGGYAISDPAQSRTLYFAPGDSVLPLTSITDRNGHRIDVEHDSSGAPLEVRHSGGYRIGVESHEGLVTSLSLRDGDEETRLVRYDYEDRRLTGVVNASGEPLRFGYDEAGRITSWTDRNGAWYRYTYERGRCVRAEGAGGFLSGSLEYDDVDRVTYWTDSLGRRTAYHLNEAGQTVREVDPAGNEKLSEWDGHDRLLSRTDALGRTVRYDYDESGNLTRATRPNGGQTLLEYNERHLPTTVVAPDGTVSHRRYDERGNLTAVTDPTGTTTTYAYDEHGHLSGVTDALGNTRRVETDAAGLPVSVVDPLGAVTRYERDGFGRISTITDPAGGVTRFGWTTDGKPARRVLPDGATERWSYDGEGNLRTHVDALGQVTETEITHFDLPSAEVRPDGTRLEFGYDTELRLTSVTNEQGLVWRYEYDVAGNLVAETDFNERTVTYRHDPAGQLLERTNGVGETTFFARDVLGNVVERRSGSVTTAFTYDDVGRLLEAVDGDTRVTFQRDPLGRVLAESVNGRTVRSDYDALGRRIMRRTPSGAESTWEHDANSRPVALHTAGRTLRFEHDAVGREVRRGLGTEAVLDQEWDASHQLRSQSITGGAGRQLQQRSYTYREDGFLTGIDDQLAGPRLFDLDRGGRVTAVHGAGWTERYAYDAAGNVAQASWPTPPTAGDADAVGDREYTGTLIRRAGNVRYEHDPQGRVVLRQQKRLSHKPNTWRYYWDADDRLVGCLTPDGTYWLYRYDPLGRRVCKQRLTPDRSRVAEQVDFVWDGVALAEQAHSDGVPNGPQLGDARVTVWNYEPGTFKPITQNERSPLRRAPQEWVDEQFYSIVTDLVGTPTELVNDHGGIAWYHHTTLWGTTLDQSRAGAYTPLRFPGQYHDPETGFNYNYHRHYDPTTGRYASTDPLGLVAGPNPHRYVGNPNKWIDPLGLAACNVYHSSRQEALDAAHDRAGIPRGTEPDQRWEVGNDPSRRGIPGYRYSEDSGTHGHYRQFETSNGSRVIAEHTNDGEPHFHSGQPKGDPAREAVDFGWSDEHNRDIERYQQIGGSHHHYYPR